VAWVTTLLLMKWDLLKNSAVLFQKLSGLRFFFSVEVAPYLILGNYPGTGIHKTDDS
jgi:hypothetical protein